MSRYNFHPVNREQSYLLPPDLKEWLPEGDLAWFIVDATGQMDLEAFYRKYRADGQGNTAYEPSMMVSLLLYAYSMGIRSSRKIERMCTRDIAFRVITANQAPDHSTIARFRQANEEELTEIFTQVLRLCAEAGLVQVGLVAIDGTKLKANASLAANRKYRSIKQEIQQILKEAAAKDAEEDDIYGPENRGDELPEELKDRQQRLARLREAKERLEQETAEAAAKQEEKIRQGQEEERERGRKQRGRKPNPPDKTVSPEAKANITDPESRIMKTHTGYVQGYNAQAVVTKEQIIIAADLTQEENDVHQLHPLLDQAQKELSAVGVEEEIGTALADAGYWSEENIQEADPEGPELLVATKKNWKQRQALREKGPPQGRIPKDLSPRERMERKLRTKHGWDLYCQRGWMVEGVMGQTKYVRDCDCLMRRGYEAAQSEWKLIATTHNLLKLWRKTQAGCAAIGGLN